MGHCAATVAAVGPAVAHLAELAIAQLSNAGGSLAGALHNMPDVTTSMVVFTGFACPSATPLPAFRMLQAGRGPAGLGGGCGRVASPLFPGYAPSRA